MRAATPGSHQALRRDAPSKLAVHTSQSYVATFGSTYTSNPFSEQCSKSVIEEMHQSVPVAGNGRRRAES